MYAETIRLPSNSVNNVQTLNWPLLQSEYEIFCFAQNINGACYKPHIDKNEQYAVVKEKKRTQNMWKTQLEDSNSTLISNH